MTDCQVLRCSLPFYEARAFLQKPTRIDVGLCQDHIGQFDRGDECVYDYDKTSCSSGETWLPPRTCSQQLDPKDRLAQDGIRALSQRAVGAMYRD